MPQWMNVAQHTTQSIHPLTFKFRIFELPALVDLIMLITAFSSEINHQSPSLVDCFFPTEPCSKSKKPLERQGETCLSRAELRYCCHSLHPQNNLRPDQPTLKCIVSIQSSNKLYVQGWNKTLEHFHILF